MSANRAKEYFEFLAEMGLTKHYGSLDTTRKLANLCQIGPGQAVLDLGCVVGATPVFLTREMGSQVIGADLIEGMVQISHLRAEKYKVQNKTAFITADARVLPFLDNNQPSAEIKVR
ncbi:MAG: class I SAM-dependent methyltransferase [Chloroflexi bacterium]|nr:class I SAM-dependent methyltransferase [Chloroflexota bacterium]